MITRARLKKLEEKAKERYVPEEIIINYCKPNGEVIRLACYKPIAIIPSDEQENIKGIEGKGAIFADRIIIDKHADEDNKIGDKRLYEREGFIVLPEKRICE